MGILYNDERILRRAVGVIVSAKYLPMTRSVVGVSEEATYVLRDGVLHNPSPATMNEDGEEEDWPLLENPVYSIDELDDERIVYSMLWMTGVFVYDFRTQTSVRVELPGYEERYCTVKGTSVVATFDGDSTNDLVYRINPDDLTARLVCNGHTDRIGGVCLLTQDRFIVWTNHAGAEYEYTAYDFSEGGIREAFRITTPGRADDCNSWPVGDDGRFAIDYEDFRVQCYSVDGRLLHDDVSEDTVELVHFVGNDLIVYTYTEDSDRVRIEFNEDFSNGTVDFIKSRDSVESDDEYEHDDTPIELAIVRTPAMTVLM